MVSIFGDSIAVGHIDDQGGWPARLQSFYSSLSLKGKTPDTQSIHNFSISGATTHDLLSRGEIELTHLEWDNPRIVIIALGTNDSALNMATQEPQVAIDTFTNNLTSFIKATQAYRFNKTYLLTLPLVDEKKVFPMVWEPNWGYSNDSIALFNTAIKEIGSKLDVEIFDVAKQISKEELADGVHLSPSGHKKIFRLVEKTITPLLYPEAMMQLINLNANKSS